MYIVFKPKKVGQSYRLTYFRIVGLFTIKETAYWLDLAMFCNAATYAHK